MTGSTTTTPDHPDRLGGLPRRRRRVPGGMPPNTLLGWPIVDRYTGTFLRVVPPFNRDFSPTATVKDS